MPFHRMSRAERYMTSILVMANLLHSRDPDLQQVVPMRLLLHRICLCRLSSWISSPAPSLATPNLLPPAIFSKGIMVDLLDEFSSNLDGSVSITDEDRNSVHDLTYPYDHKNLQPRSHASNGSRNIVGSPRALKSRYSRQGKSAGSLF